MSTWDLSATKSSGTPSPNVEYLSPATAVSTADCWFDISTTGHFWVRRRFEVLQQLAGKLIADAPQIAEVGCGHGLLQRQIEDVYCRSVSGFDLNEYALRRNISRRSKLYCYDILQKEPSLREHFDLIFLFDVLEHIRDEDRFMDALQFHLAPKGKLVLNVPAGQWLFSKYDEADGHLRRYSIDRLQAVALRNGLAIERCTYWGLPLVPLIMLRKLWLMGERDPDEAVTKGFDSYSSSFNAALRILSQCEVIPHRWSGTSLMAVLGKASGAVPPPAA